jgi:hypothetical protein
MNGEFIVGSRVFLTNEKRRWEKRTRSGGDAPDHHLVDVARLVIGRDSFRLMVVYKSCLQTCFS